VQGPISFRVEGNGVRFPEGIVDPAAFIRVVQRALNARLLRRKFVVFSFGVEFELEGEKVPMMIDSDGWAFIDCKENSSRVRESVLLGILSSGDFRELQPTPVAAQ
jgi:hypothetical protein